MVKLITFQHKEKAAVPPKKTQYPDASPPSNYLKHYLCLQKLKNKLFF